MAGGASATAEEPEHNVDESNFATNHIASQRPGRVIGTEYWSRDHMDQYGGLAIMEAVPADDGFTHTKHT